MLSVNSYLADAWQARTASQILYCARMASDNLDAYSLICSRYGWTEGKRALVAGWRNDIAQLTVSAHNLTEERVTDNG
jgi:hypothetical protein